MQNAKKRSVLVLLAMVLVFSLISLPAFAQASASVGTLEELTGALEQGGTIVLTGEIEVTQTLTISANTTLQGGSLKRAANFTGTMLQVNSGTLTLQDITVDGNAVANSNYMLLVKNSAKLQMQQGAKLTNGSGNGAIKLENGAQMEMSGGEISQNILKINNVTAAVYMQSGAAFTMSGGAIQNNTADKFDQNYVGASAVYVSENSEFYFNGGEISGNKSFLGAGITAYGKVVINGGSLLNNQANGEADILGTGGAIYIRDGGNVTLENGTISGNTAIGNGGAIMLESATMSKVPQFTMNGGSIVNNVSQEGNSGAIYTYYWEEVPTVTINGGEISGNKEFGEDPSGITLDFDVLLNLSGSPTIADPIDITNTYYDEDEEEELPYSPFTMIQITGAFSPTQAIPIQPFYAEGCVGQKVIDFTSSSGTADPSLFTCLTTSWGFKKSEDTNTLEFAPARKVIFKDGYYHYFDDFEQHLVVGELIDEPANVPAKPGYKIEGWYTDASLTEESKWDFAIDTLPAETPEDTGSFILYVKWVEAPDTPTPTPGTDSDDDSGTVILPESSQSTSSGSNPATGGAYHMLLSLAVAGVLAAGGSLVFLGKR